MDFLKIAVFCVGVGVVVLIMIAAIANAIHDLRRENKKTNLGGYDEEYF